MTHLAYTLFIVKEGAQGWKPEHETKEPPKHYCFIKSKRYMTRTIMSCLTPVNMSGFANTPLTRSTDGVLVFPWVTIIALFDDIFCPMPLNITGLAYVLFSRLLKIVLIFPWVIIDLFNYIFRLMPSDISGFTYTLFSRFLKGVLVYPCI